MTKNEKRGWEYEHSVTTGEERVGSGRLAHRQKKSDQSTRRKRTDPPTENVII